MNTHNPLLHILLSFVDYHMFIEVRLGKYNTFKQRIELAELKQL
jgi:hypothetical protein